MLTKLHVIFTGANYWAIPELPKSITGDFAMIGGYRWVKSRRTFSKRWQLFACPKNYRVLTPQETMAQLS